MGGQAGLRRLPGSQGSYEGSKTVSNRFSIPPPFNTPLLASTVSLISPVDFSEHATCLDPV